MKNEPRQAEAFLKMPDSRIRGVVVYGNDDGLIAERALMLAKTVCDDLKDPFRVVDIGGDVLKGRPRAAGRRVHRRTEAQGRGREGGFGAARTGARSRRQDAQARNRGAEPNRQRGGVIPAKLKRPINGS
jgi:hypothetical protein